MEVHSYNKTAADVNDLVREFVRLIDGLSAESRRLWDSAQRRDFNVGMIGGFRPHSFEFRLDPDVLESAVRLKAGVVMTIYATGRHFSGRGGEPPQRVMEPGTYVGPSPKRSGSRSGARHERGRSVALGSRADAVTRPYAAPRRVRRHWTSVERHAE